MPGVARTIAESRLASHARSGGGRVVTGCASSLIAMRRARAGAGLGVGAEAVDDIVTWIARAARPWRPLG
jgi:hypothetical protein